MSRGVATSVGRASVLVHMSSGTGQSIRSGGPMILLLIDADGGGVAFACWSTTEAAVALLCACLPVLRPIFKGAYARFSSVRRMRDSARGSSGRDRQPDHVFFGYKKVPESTVRTSQSRDSTVWGLETARARDDSGSAGEEAAMELYRRA